MGVLKNYYDRVEKISNVYVEFYDLDCEVSIGVDIYDSEFDFLIGEGFYHSDVFSLVFKDLSNGKFFNFVCLESEILSVVSDYYDHIL